MAIKIDELIKDLGQLTVVEAGELAKKLEIKSYVMTGQSGGLIASKANCLHIPTNETPRIQESHILIGHIVCGLVEKKIFPDLASVN